MENKNPLSKKIDAFFVLSKFLISLSSQGKMVKQLQTLKFFEK